LRGRTGNYVKIVQRVPVKIVMDNPPADVALGPGMSVVPSVRVDPAPSLHERFGEWLRPFFEQLRGWLGAPAQRDRALPLRQAAQAPTPG
jgi:hypothetical protein